MSTISCTVKQIEMENDRTGVPQLGVRARCRECGHCTEAFGRSEASIKRALATLREECPEEERNFYVDEASE